MTFGSDSQLSEYAKHEKNDGGCQCVTDRALRWNLL